MIEYDYKNLPRSVIQVMQRRNIHSVAYFGSMWMFLGIQNTMYKVDGDYLFSRKDKPVFVVPSNSLVTMYNPELQEYERICFESAPQYDYHEERSINNYTRGFEEFCYNAGDESCGWIGFDLRSYLQKTYSKEINIVANDWKDILIESYGVCKRFDVFKNYTENAIFGWDENEKPYQLAFESANQLYSFVYELKERMKTYPVGSKWSDLYDSVQAGTISKEDFVKTLVGE